ncbi:MAG: hypothetical protein OEY14_00770, partial [Myxococcales bacterium]|nr:hypothetical protein [Myxococcales bacterium]
MKNNGGVVRTLLVVRDEDLRSQLIQLLSARGWQHALADTPRAAARDAREGGFELAIVEIRRDIESNDLRRLCAIMGSRGRLLVIAEPPLLPGALDAGAAEFALPSDDRGTLDARLSLLQRAVDATRGRDQELHRLRAALESSASTREARNLFLAHMGHELRSPLGQILRHGDALFTRSCALEGAEGLLDDLQPV